MKGRLPVYKDSFFCGTERPDGLGLEMTYEDRSVLCDVHVNTKFEGYTNVVHGGMVFGIMDVMLWYAIYMETRIVAMTRKIEAEFLKPVMCTAHYKAVARMDSIDGRDIRASSWIENSDGEVCAKVTALFREGKEIDWPTFLTRFDFDITTPEIRDYFLAPLQGALTGGTLPGD